MVELKGSLSGIGLPAITQLIGDLHHSGTLEVYKGSAGGLLYFDDGRLVAASFGDQDGLKAVASFALELGDGAFTFIEGAPPVERTLDMSPRELQAYLSRVASGETHLEVVEPGALATQPDVPAEIGACPVLGFADDQSRHYSRPTALHRCYATGRASLVTGQEQRELCLAGRYSACPRYRASSVALTPGVATYQPAPTPLVLEETAVPATQQPVSVPAGVASRLSALGEMSLASADTTAQTTPRWMMEGDDQAPTPEEGDARTHPRRSPPGGLLLVAGGALLGLMVLALAVVVAMPSLNSGLMQKPNQAATQAFEPIPTLTRVPSTPAIASAAIATTPPTLAPTATPVQRAAAPTSAPRAASAGGPRTLTDIRFASGPAADWIENPPYVAWSDGAYRLQARQAARFVAVAAPTSELLRDVIVSATLRKTGGPPGGGYGVLIRDQGDVRDGVNQIMNAYIFEVGDLGEFGIWRRDRDHWIDLLPWTSSPAVRQGGSPNELSVRATGDRMMFSVNGIEVANVQDNALLAGGVGVFVGGDYNEAALDRFTVQVPN